MHTEVSHSIPKNTSAINMGPGTKKQQSTTQSHQADTKAFHESYQTGTGGPL